MSGHFTIATPLPRPVQRILSATDAHVLHTTNAVKIQCQSSFSVQFSVTFYFLPVDDSPKNLRRLSASSKTRDVFFMSSFTSHFILHVVMMKRSNLNNGGV